FILGPAERAHGKCGHGGALAVIGRAGDDREPRSAVGAIEEGIAITPVVRIEKLGQAVVASRHIGGNEDRSRCVARRLTGLDPKLAIAKWRLSVPRQAVNLCEWRKFGDQVEKKAIERLGVALDFDQDTVSPILDKAKELPSRRQAVHERP